VGEPEVVVDTETRGIHPGPPVIAVGAGADCMSVATEPLAAVRSRSAAEDVEAVAVVVGARWPTGRRPSAVERERLAREVRPCLDRGHPPAVVQQAMTGNLDGARNPVAVAVARLRELAATEPQPPAATSAGSPRIR
jgi:hypothetical protein